VKRLEQLGKVACRAIDRRRVFPEGVAEVIAKLRLLQEPGSAVGQVLGPAVDVADVPSSVMQYLGDDEPEAGLRGQFVVILLQFVDVVLQRGTLLLQCALDLLPELRRNRRDRPRGRMQAGAIPNPVSRSFWFAAYSRHLTELDPKLLRPQHEIVQ